MLSQEFNFIGVDYGSKKAGTTAVAYLAGERLYLRQSAKNKDADHWLKELVSELDAGTVCIDAPLSLPGALRGKGDNYFYRESDRICKAMSPMFLGGLTARAIKLKDDCPSRIFIEVYPAELVRQIDDIKDFYTKKAAISHEALECLKKHLPFNWELPPANWHQYDALLCWLTGFRLKKGEALTFGNKEEGLIVV